MTNCRRHQNAGFRHFRKTHDARRECVDRGPAFFNFNASIRATAWKSHHRRRYSRHARSRRCCAKRRSARRIDPAKAWTRDTSTKRYTATAVTDVDVTLHTVSCNRQVHLRAGTLLTIDVLVTLRGRRRNRRDAALQRCNSLLRGNQLGRVRSKQGRGSRAAKAADGYIQLFLFLQQNLTGRFPGTRGGIHRVCGSVVRGYRASRLFGFGFVRGDNR